VTAHRKLINTLMHSIPHQKTPTLTVNHTITYAVKG